MNYDNSPKNKLYTLSVAGVMSALSVLLALTPLGYIKASPVMSFTIIHIPVIIASIIAGPIAGMTVGLFFGATSLLTAVGDSSILAPFVINPLVSIAPRILIGLITAYAYRGLGLIPVLPKSTIAAVSAFIGSITNTIGFFGAMYLLYGNRIKPLMQGKGYIATLLLFAPPSLMEATVAAITTGIVVTTIAITNKHRKAKLLST